MFELVVFKSLENKKYNQIFLEIKYFDTKTNFLRASWIADLDCDREKKKSGYFSHVSK